MNLKVGMIVLAIAIGGLFYRILSIKHFELRPQQTSYQALPTTSQPKSAAQLPEPAAATVPSISEKQSSIQQQVLQMAAASNGISENPAQDLARLKRIAAALTPDQSLALGEFVTSREQPYHARFLATELLGLSGVTPSKVAALTHIASTAMDESDRQGLKHEYILRKVAIDEIANNSSTQEAISSIQDVLARQTNPIVRDQALMMLGVLKAGKLSEYRNQEEQLLTAAATGGKS